jgi:membrane fusion protein, multidrug efflux system
MADVAQQDQREQREQRRPEPPPEKPVRPRRRKRRWLILGAILFLAVGGFFIWEWLSARETTDDAQVDAHISPISARVGGIVVAVYVDDNQLVQDGVVLFQLDPTDYKVAVAQAEAELANAQSAAQGARESVPSTTISSTNQLSASEAALRASEAAVAVAQKGVASAEANLKAAQARVREAEANYIRAAKDVERYKLLVAKEEISQQQYDAAVATADADRATVESNRALVAQAEQQVASAQSQVQQSRMQQAQAAASARAASNAPQLIAVQRAQAGSAVATVQQRKAALDQARLNLQYTTVRAPFTGIAGNKNIQVGQVITAGQQMLALVPLEDVYVTANYKETQLKKMRVGQRATFSVDALGGREYKGRVDTIAPATGSRFSLLPPENATGNYVKVVQRIPVKIVLEPGENRDHLLRVGMSVEPKVWVR